MSHLTTRSTLMIAGGARCMVARGDGASASPREDVTILIEVHDAASNAATATQTMRVWQSGCIG